MEKIFDSTFRTELVNSLQDAGITSDEAAKIVNNRYKAAVKKAAIDYLENIIGLLKKDKYEAVKNLLSFSPGGDDMGRDNYYIDFYPACNLDDIYDVLCVLSKNRD